MSVVTEYRKTGTKTGIVNYIVYFVNPNMGMLTFIVVLG